MLPFAAYLRRHLGVIAPRAANISAGSFTAGIIALIGACFVVPQHTHDVLAVADSMSFLAAPPEVFWQWECYAAVGARGGQTKPVCGAIVFGSWAVSAILLPVLLVGIFFSESLLLLTRLEPSWATPIRSALRHSVFWHLGFWELMGAVAVFRISLRRGFPNAARATLPYSSVRLRCDSDLR